MATSSPDITVAVSDFVLTLADPNHDPQVLESLQQSCLAGELSLRKIFATDRSNHILDDPYIGLFDIFSLPREALLFQSRDWDDPDMDFIWKSRDKEHHFPKKHLLPVHPAWRKTHGTPCIVGDLPSFCKAWNVFTSGVLSTVQRWENIIVAGGAVLASLTSFPSSSPTDLFKTYQSYPYKNSDIDLFLWGLTEEEAKIRMADIFEAINSSSSALGWNAICFRSKNTITIQTEYPKRPVQIVMRLYKSPSEILSSFDINSGCVAYDGTRVWTNPRGIMAIVKQQNTIDLTRRSPSYEHRLTKYSIRGYEVFYDALDRNKIDYASLADPERDYFPQGLGRLIVYEIMNCDYTHFLRLYEDSDQSARSSPVPTESLRHSNYDYAWCRIPYSSKWWNPHLVRNHVEDVCTKIIKVVKIPEGAEAHNHVLTWGTMTECLERCCEDFDASREEGQTSGLPSALFRGPAQFITDDPGRQLIGSFNPITYDDWEAQAYIKP